VSGSILALTDATGQPLRAYHYQAFGIPEEARGDRQPFRFSAREWDKEIKLYFSRARYYDPRAVRFTSEDRLTLSTHGHKYDYVL
jgi:RHS repeat-associated protein